MKFKQLKIFQVVAQQGMIIKAANELRYVQSNITRKDAYLTSTLEKYI